MQTNCMHYDNKDMHYASLSRSCYFSYGNNGNLGRLEETSKLSTLESRTRTTSHNVFYSATLRQCDNLIFKVTNSLLNIIIIENIKTSYNHLEPVQGPLDIVAHIRT